MGVEFYGDVYFSSLYGYEDMPYPIFLRVQKYVLLFFQLSIGMAIKVSNGSGPIKFTLQICGFASIIEAYQWGCGQFQPPVRISMNTTCLRFC